MRAFWVLVADDHAGAPPALQELARGANSVVCFPEEVTAALEARAHPAWIAGVAPVSHHPRGPRGGLRRRPQPLERGAQQPAPL